MSTTNIELANLDRSSYPELSDKAFKLLSRIAFLANGNTDPVPYPSAIAEQELSINRKACLRLLTALKDAGFVTFETVHKTRVVSLTAQAKLLTSSPIISAVANLDSSSCTGAGAGVDMPDGARVSLFEHLSAKGYYLPSVFVRDNERFKNYVNEPLLASVRENLFKFDLSPIVKAAGLAEFKPFGKAHNWQFDFTDLQDLLEPTISHMEQVDQLFPNFIAYHYNAPQYAEHWKQFFIFSIILELTAGLGDCFRCHDEFDSLGANFIECWFEHQHGLLFACLNACYLSDSTTYKVANRIAANFSPVSASSILPYAQKCIKNEVVALLNKEDAANRCLAAFKASFIHYVEAQEFAIMGHITHYGAQDYLDGVWSKKIMAGLLCYDSQYFIPRISWPLILFRTLVGACSLSELTSGATQLRQTKAAVTVYKTFTKPQRLELERLVVDLAPYFPCFALVPNLLQSFDEKDNKYYGFDLSEFTKP